MATETVVSVDCEVDGPIPGPNSMYSFGAAAFDSKGKLLTTFSRNLVTLEGASADPDTAKWWSERPHAYAKARENPQPIKEAMLDYVKWLRSLSNPTRLAFPVVFDGMWEHWYLIRFVGEDPLSFSGIDIKTLAMVALKLPYRQCTKRNMPKHWFSEKKHNHIAVDDAVEQGETYFKIRKDLCI